MRCQKSESVGAFEKTMAASVMAIMCNEYRPYVYVPSLVIRGTRYILNQLLSE